MEKKEINPWQWQQPFGFAQATLVHSSCRTLYCSGQASVDIEGKPIHLGDMAAQIGQALNNLETLLSEAGFCLSDVVRLAHYTTDVNLLLANWNILTKRFADIRCQPSMTLLGVSHLAFPGLLIEIEATAVQ